MKNRNPQATTEQPAHKPKYTKYTHKYVNNFGLAWQASIYLKGSQG